MNHYHIHSQNQYGIVCAYFQVWVCQICNMVHKSCIWYTIKSTKVYFSIGIGLQLFWSIKVDAVTSTHRKKS